MFKPDYEQIKAWVASGQMASDLDEATRQGLIETQKPLLQAFVRTFGGADGQMVLDYLANASVLRAPVDHRKTGADYLAFAQNRQGQNQLFALMIELYELGKTLERNPNGDGTGSRSGGDGDDGNASGPDDGPGWSGFDGDGDIAIR
jgi:hypothetical protein